MSLFRLLYKLNSMKIRIFIVCTFQEADRIKIAYFTQSGSVFRGADVSLGCVQWAPRFYQQRSTAGGDQDVDREAAVCDC